MSELTDTKEPKCLADTFQKVDLAVYGPVGQALAEIQNKLWNGRVYDVNGKRLKDIGQWLVAIERGEWLGPLFSPVELAQVANGGGA